MDTNRKKIIGFNFGFNKTILETAILLENTIVTSKIGVRVGIFAEYKLNETLFLLPKVELSVNNYKYGYEYFPIPLSLEFAFHTKSKNEKLKSFFTVGPSVKIPIKTPNEEYQGYRDIPLNFSLDVSIGIEKAFENLVISPELRYSHGFTDINSDENLYLIKMHSLSLIFNLL